jgi:hypothetical protein
MKVKSRISSGPLAWNAKHLHLPLIATQNRRQDHGIGEVDILTFISYFAAVCAISLAAANRTSGAAAPAGTRFVPGFRRLVFRP